MTLTTQALNLKLAIPFRMSHDVQYDAHNLLIQIEADGLVGLGEAAPWVYYGEQRESVLGAITSFAGARGDDVTAVRHITGAL